MKDIQLLSFLLCCTTCSVQEAIEIAGKVRLHMENRTDTERLAWLATCSTKTFSRITFAAYGQREHVPREFRSGEVKARGMRYAIDAAMDESEQE